MCDKTQFRYCPSKIDDCLQLLIIRLNLIKGFKTLSCCCGHNRYPITIIVRNRFGEVYDLISNQRITRKKKFYKKDDDGYYFVPESIVYWLKKGTKTRNRTAIKALKMVKDGR